MIRPVMKDQLFLAQKSVPATVEDLEIAVRCFLFWAYYSTGRWKTRMEQF